MRYPTSASTGSAEATEHSLYERMGGMMTGLGNINISGVGSNIGEQARHVAEGISVTVSGLLGIPAEHTHAAGAGGAAGGANMNKK